MLSLLRHLGSVLALFALLAGLGAHASLVTQHFRLPFTTSLSPFGQQLVNHFTYYALWLVYTPIIAWLADRVRISSERWVGPMLFHAAMSLLVTLPLGLPLRVPDATLGAPVYWCILVLANALRNQEAQRAQTQRTLELERMLAQAELQALRMQLQPHFLFNTLNTLGFLSLKGDHARIGWVVERLGDLLRNAMDGATRTTVPLGEEVDFLRSYLEIEELRFQDRLRIQWDLPTELLSLPVPSLLLQPLVENALKHGLARRRQAGLVEVAARREGPRLILTVSDDGPGPPGEGALAASPGRGLRNLRDRLDILFPGEGHLRLRPREGGGTVAEVVLPCAGGEP